MPKIQLTTPDGSTLEFEVTAAPARFGRAEDNDFVIPDASVSSYHGQISASGEGVAIKDNGSTNGTHVGGQRVTEAELAPGETFRLGSVNGVVVGEPAAVTAEEEEGAAAVAEESYFEEEAAPAPGRSWGAPSPGPAGMPVSMMAGNIGSTPCPSQLRRGFGAKTRNKEGGGGAVMLLGVLGLVICGAAAFMILQMGA